MRVVIFRDNNDSPSSAIPRADAELFLANANQIFQNAGTDIRFYLEEVAFIPNNKARMEIGGLIDFNDDPSFLSSLEMFINNRKDGVINIYFVKNTLTSEPSSGSAATPISQVIPAQLTKALWSCWVKTHFDGFNVQFPTDDISMTLAHELGHTLGLSHTHHPGGTLGQNEVGFDGDNAEVGSCNQEVVSRSAIRGNSRCVFGINNRKCEVNGDALCDTDADPNVTTERVGTVDIRGVDPNTCNYFEDGSDQRYTRDTDGVVWNPPTRNIMSYSEEDCTDEFSNHQIAIMWDRIENRFINYFIPEFSGQNQLFCTNGRTVTLVNAPPNLPLSWRVSASQEYLVHPSTRSGTGSSAFIKAASSTSVGWVIVIFEEANNCTFFESTVKIQIGNPIFNSGQVEGPSTLYLGNSAVFSGPSAQFADYYRWYFPNGGFRIISGQGSTLARIEASGSTGLKVIELRAYNSCGYRYKYIYVDVKSSSSGGGGGGGSDPCVSALILSPNPIIGNNIEALVLPPGGGGDPCLSSSFAVNDTIATNPDSFQMNNIEKEGIIFITNYLGEKIYEKKHRGKKINIRLHKLDPGIYILQYVYNDEELLSARFIKE